MRLPVKPPSFARPVRGLTRFSGVASASTAEKAQLPSRAKVVVVGGGVVGCSIAYHLTKLGVRDVILLESGQLTCGTTWHAAGLIGQLRPTRAETEMSGVYGAKLYESLEAETGYATGFKRCGSLTVARTPDRMLLLKRTASRARAFGIEAVLVSPEEAGARYSGLMRTDDLLGALWLPGDGSANPSDLCQALAAGARQGGARIFEKQRVSGFHTEDGAVRGVKTSSGAEIAADTVVCAAGQWTRTLAALAGVNVPLYSAEHFYIISDPNPGGFKVPQTLPVLRDPDAYIYAREWSGGLCVGGFEPTAKPAFPSTHGVPPDGFEFGLFDEDWVHFEPLMEGALHRLPALATAGAKLINGPESFTPDNAYILGEAPELRSFYVCAGMNSSGIASSGGAGKTLAEWITAGAPTRDVSSIDIRRFSPLHGNAPFLRERTKEVLGMHYRIVYPRQELISARPMRMSPLNADLTARGAVWGSKFGWERPNYFGPFDAGHTFGKPAWLPSVSAEHKAVREAVGVADVTSFAKISVTGPGAVRLLSRLCANDVDVAPGRLVYTQMCNERGGIEADVTVTRISPDEFFVVSPTAQATKDAHWIRRAVSPGDRVAVTDVTGAWGVLALMGPLARHVLRAATGGVTPLSNAAFPFGSWQHIDIGFVRCRAARVSYVGELGWELYAPMETLRTLYTALRAAAESVPEVAAAGGLKDIGYYAIESLRVEKGYRALPTDIAGDTSPYEAGLGWAVKLAKAGAEDVIGHASLVAAKARGVPERRLVHFAFADSSVYAHGDESILVGGVPVGWTTSVAWSGSAQRCIGMGYVTLPPPPDAEGAAARGGLWGPFLSMSEGSWEAEVFGKRELLTCVGLQPLYDPIGERVRADGI